MPPMSPKHPYQTTAEVLCALLFLHGALTTSAQLPQPEEKVLSGDELVQIALTNNLDIKISRLQPQIDQFALNGLYGAYQPTLTASQNGATRFYGSQPGGVFAEGGVEIPVPSTTTRSDNYTPGLSGALPSGLTYNVTGPLSYQKISGAESVKEYQAEPSISLDQPLLKVFLDERRRIQHLRVQEHSQDRSMDFSPSGRNRGVQRQDGLF